MADATLPELKAQAKNIENQIKEFERMNLDTSSLEDALADIETRISELEKNEKQTGGVNGKEQVGTIKLRESGTLESKEVPVYEGDTYVDVIERNRIALYVKGHERKIRDNRGSVDGLEGRPNIMSTIDVCCVNSIFIGMPKIDGN